jgi:UDP-galactopyranose mutase
MVHSTFYYAKNNGSQFLADRLAEGLDIVYNSKIEKLQKIREKWIVNEVQYDKIIFCGNIKDLPIMLKGEVDIEIYKKPIEELEYHGTTSVLCEIENNDYSWIYMPDNNHESHRIICTGNFSESNNSANILTGTIEFTDEVDKDVILENLKKMPYSPRYLTHRFTQYTYPIQSSSTKKMIRDLKEELDVQGIHLLGRFAEWEYYNMDAAIGGALDLNTTIS